MQYYINDIKDAIIAAAAADTDADADAITTDADADAITSSRCNDVSSRCNDVQSSNYSNIMIVHHFNVVPTSCACCSLVTSPMAKELLAHQRHVCHCYLFLRQHAYLSCTTV